MRNCFWHSIYDIEQKEKIFTNFDLKRNLFSLILDKKINQANPFEKVADSEVRKKFAFSLNP